jgi:hypothetical protein
MVSTLQFLQTKQVECHYGVWDHISSKHSFHLSIYLSIKSTKNIAFQQHVGVCMYAGLGLLMSALFCLLLWFGSSQYNANIALNHIACLNAWLNCYQEWACIQQAAGCLVKAMKHGFMSR